MLVVLGAGFFAHLLLHAPKTLDPRPWFIIRVRIVALDVHFKHVAAVSELPALDAVQLFAVRGAIVIDESLVIEANCVDHERVAFIMADRFAIPGRLWSRRMEPVDIDAPYLRVARKDHRDLFRCLEEIDRLETTVRHEGRNAGRLATRSRPLPHLAGPQFLVFLLP